MSNYLYHTGWYGLALRQIIQKSKSVFPFDWETIADNFARTARRSSKKSRSPQTSISWEIYQSEAE